MKISQRHALLLACTALAAPLASAPAWAQNGEIVVTAQRREQSVLTVPLAIQAVSGEDLQASGIKQITDLQFQTPGYNVSDSNGYTQIFIRGVGNAIFVGADPSVATFIDDVPRIYGSMVNNFVNVERVEVLKGAQGGLYGRNATGGVVNIVTRQPSTDGYRADARLSFGKFQSLEVDGYLNVPMGDHVALNISGQRRSSHPWFKNLAPANPYTAAMFPGTPIPGLGNVNFLPTGPGGAFVPNTPEQTAAFFNSGVNNSDVGNQDFYAVDGKLLVKPTDNFKITFAGDYSKKDDSQGNAQYQVAPVYEQYALEETFHAFGIPTNFPAGLIQGSPPKFKVSNGAPGFVRLTDYGGSATAVLSLDNVDLTSITAYRKQHTQFLDDLGASTLPFTSAFVDNHKHYFYQELRAVSNFTGPFQFITGASYLKSFFQGYTDVPILTPLFTLPTARSQDRVKNWSVYFQGSYDFTPNLTLTASGRYIHEKNTAQFFALTNANVVPFVDPVGDPVNSTEKKFLPAATLSYKLQGGGNVYARWARGFKAGGVNPVANASAFVTPDGVYHADSGSIFQGETVDTFEVGYKGELFDRKVQLTADVFYNDYKNLQTAAHANAAHANTVILAIINAGTARTYGVEGTLAWHVTPSLNLSATAGYLNAKYKDFKNTDTTILDAFDHSHQRMINSPEFQASFNANLDQPINDNINLIGNLLVSHTSSVLYQFSGNECGASGIVGVTCLPDAVGKAYWLTNARIGIKTSDDRFEIAAFANNLFNAAYQTYGNSNAGNTTQYTWGNPRIIGVEATIHLGH